MQSVDQAELTSTLSRLVGQRDLTLGSLHSRKGLDLHVVLGLAATCLDAHAVKNEIEVSQLLEQWLQSTGTMLRCDRAELRRWLIDLRYWHREDGGRRYMRADMSLGANGACLEALAQEASDIVKKAVESRRQAKAVRHANH
jgi:Uncharacterized protein conserved in bacteria (DUF2087)